MRALLPTTTDDLPPHIQDLPTAELSLFIVRGSSCGPTPWPVN
jgi:hypothetical protein